MPQRSRHEPHHDAAEPPQLLQALQAQASRLRMLHEIDRGILSARSVQDLASDALPHVREALGCRWASLVLLTPDDSGMELFAQDGSAVESEVTVGTLLPIQGLEAHLAAMRRDEVPIFEDLAQLKEVPPILQVAASVGVRSLASAPLISDGVLLGFLAASAEEPRAFSPDDVQVLREVAAQLAIGISQARLREQEARQTGELRELIDHLRENEQLRRELLSSLVRAQEDERARIAADIHDDTVQKMTAVGLSLGSIAKQIAGSEQAEGLARLEESVREAIECLRTLLFEIHPSVLQTAGLATALQEQLQQLNREQATLYRLENRLEAEPRAEIRVVAYRISQEALRNIRKHAGAREATVSLENRDQGIHVRIRDDGVGASSEDLQRPQPGHLGVNSIRERADLAGGWSRISGEPGRGTTVEFWLPE